MQKKIVLLFLFLLETVSVCGQVDLDNRDFYKWFDASVGQENTGLIDGFEYRELYQTRNGNHKFYVSSSFLNGNIAYKGQLYFDVKIKYDLHEDEVILKIPTQTITHTIQLIKEKVDSFSINDSEFVFLTNVMGYKDGFYEIIFKSDDISMYKKNIKTSNKYYSGRSIFYSFSYKEEYLLLYKDKYHKIKKTKKSLTKILPDNKKEIDLFYKSQNELLRADYDLFAQRLMSELKNKRK